MKVKDVMTQSAVCCAAGTNVGEAVELFWMHNCGMLPVATKNLVTCKPEDEIHEALQTMADKRVRRLPVVNEQGVPQGILSMDDIITYGDLNKWQGCCELSAEEIIRALKKLYGQKPPAVRSHAAGT